MALWVTFLSDYGVDDVCVGVCRGVIARTAPEVRVLDVCHAVIPQDVEHGALFLAGALPYLPDRSVHLALVDPVTSAGGARGVVVQAADGSLFVAPDNGIASMAWRRAGGAVAAYEIMDRSLFLPNPSPVFRGRDIFAPVAARLADGLEPSAVGPAIDVAGLVVLTMRGCEVDDDHVHGEIVVTDHFGNLALNITRNDLEAAGMALGDIVEVRMASRTMRVPFRLTYGEVPPGHLVVCEDSQRRITLAVNLGRAARTLRGDRTDPVVISRVLAEPGTTRATGSVDPGMTAGSGREGRSGAA